MKLPKELDQNIQNIDDNECFEWCLVRYVNPADHHSVKIKKTGKDFAKKLDFKDIKFPVKNRDIHKIEKKNSIENSIRKNIQFMYQKNVVRKHMLIYF